MARFPSSSGKWAFTLVSSLAIFSTLIPSSQAQTFVQGTDAAGVTRLLANDRNPALYTKDFGDCLPGGSIINVTRFDAAYYADNMTVLFHFDGTSNLQSEAVMMYISVDAYGEDRYDLTFNPCDANIFSACPINGSIPISAEAIIPVAPSDVSGIIPIALAIPDFEGSAMLRIFSNATQTEVACYRAVMTNGASFSQPAAVPPVLAVFTVAAMLASFATAIYGVNIPAMRTHYAHSLPVLVVFEVFQSIFFTGALNVDWPSVCAAFWSNFAWSAGLIHTKSLTNSINKFVGQNLGNVSEVGSAGSTIINNDGGLQKQIYGRNLGKYWQLSQKSIDVGRDWIGRLPVIEKRGLEERAATTNASLGIGYSWSGGPEDPGLPVPGNWTGFPGVLSDIQIPASDAFLISLVWFAIIMVIIVAATVAFKWAVEGMVRMKWLREDRLEIFRSKWLGFLAVVALRICLIAFSTMTILTIYQFSRGGNTGTIALAAILFIIFFGGGLAVAGYACYYRLRFGSFSSSPDRLHFERKKVMGFLPWYSTVRDSKLHEQDRTKTFAASLPFFRIQHIEKNAERPTVHEDPVYIKHFGWLSARYRRTRWWFFAYWVAYQFVRACFIGGAQGNPHAQVYGLLAVEIVAFIAIAWISPFEGRRNTVLAVYMLSISKIASTGVSIAFLPEFNTPRIIATVLGVVIIVIQGFLVIGTLILIVLSVISSYFSIMRNREEFSPRSWDGMRVKYYSHLELKATDLPPPPKPEPPPPEELKEPYFDVKTVRRVPKVEDEAHLEDDDYVPDLDGGADPRESNGSLPGPLASGRASRTQSIRSTMSYGQLPYGARVHRASWSSRDFGNWQMQELQKPDSPFRSASRGHSGSHTANTSVSFQDLPEQLPKSQRSQTGMRPATPTKATQEAFASQRVGSARF